MLPGRLQAGDMRKHKDVMATTAATVLFAMLTHSAYSPQLRASRGSNEHAVTLIY
jgi:hypothetical protein